MEMFKTGYDWCFEAELRILNLADWDTKMASYEESYYTEKIDLDEFNRRIELCKIKPDSTPRKTEEYLEYRMYGLVPYNLSEIQKGIQYGHAVVEYAQSCKGMQNMEKIYNKWATKDKTFIILNGGTTNSNPDKLGTLNKHLITLTDNIISNEVFYEPDLNDALTAIVFLVDERVWDRETYKDFVGAPYTWPSYRKPSEKEKEKWTADNNKNYEAWVEKIGGTKNAFLREFLRNFRLA